MSRSQYHLDNRSCVMDEADKNNYLFSLINTENNGAYNNKFKIET